MDDGAGLTAYVKTSDGKQYTAAEVQKMFAESKVHCDRCGGSETAVAAEVVNDPPAQYLCYNCNEYFDEN